MERGLYIAASGVIAFEKALDLAGNNIANANTGGYQARKAVFAEVLAQAGERRVSQVAFGGAAVDDSPGVVRHTGRTLDFALDGPGYFVVETPAGVQLTRSLSANVGSDGFLVDQSGNAVLDQNGKQIALPDPGESLDIGDDGEIMAGGVPVGKIGVVERLQQLEEREPSPTALTASDLIWREESKIVSGALEGSNTKAVKEMISVIRASRSFESLTKMVQNFSDIDRQLANGFGKR